MPKGRTAKQLKALRKKFRLGEFKTKKRRVTNTNSGARGGVRRRASRVTVKRLSTPKNNPFFY